MPVHIRYSKLLGEGRIGQVFEAVMQDEGAEYQNIALKRVRNLPNGRIQRPFLRHEACALAMLQGHPSIPKVYAWGESQHYQYLAMEQLGTDVLTWWENNRRVTVRNIGAIAIQMLDVLKYVHSHGIVHGDLSLKNMMLSPGDHSCKRVYLIDFGLSAPYLHPGTTEHIPQRVMPRIRGTKIFASLNNHRHLILSRRDDLEALAYMLIDLALGGSLPWLHAEDPVHMYEIKAACTGATLCKGPIEVLGRFLDYCRELKFTEDPDYALWESEFKKLSPDLYNNSMFDASVNVPRLLAGTATYVEALDNRSYVEALDNPSENQWLTVATHKSDGFKPVDSGYNHAYCLDEEYMLGDERAIVEGLRRIDEVPEAEDTFFGMDDEECIPEVMYGGE
ncbi:kinase-like domain-containing protein [Earliella scabrosa]|nr:kinase-like domain-containing protein [Earliella scabrosa]